MTRHLRRLGSRFSVSLPTDDEGYLGRECEKCKSYFKIVPGTGLDGATSCVCPYCGHRAEQSDFSTQAQIDYATSVATQQVVGAVTNDMKDMARSFNRNYSRGLFSLKMSVTSRPSPIRYYVEKDLETDVVCSSCTLKYAIYGVFGFCPDCGIHNSLQILEKNLELAKKEIALADGAENADLKEHLVGDALENAVSAFDGFGREAAMAHVSAASKPKQVEKLTFQNLTAADVALESLFGFKLRDAVSNDSWALLVRCFQKRHLLAHRMGVIDDKYVAATNDSSAVVGRKVRISRDEVSNLLVAVATLGRSLVFALNESQNDDSGSGVVTDGTE